MKIIIPMAGLGKRYNTNNFLSPKPLIEIDGSPMIQHVISLYPKNSEFIFLCNEDHLRETNIKRILKYLAPHSTIVSISNSQLEGPVSSCIPILGNIDDSEEVIVNYCDFTQEWNYSEFIDSVHSKNADGAIVTFKGFNPFSLGETYYCYLKVNEDGWITDLREKQSFSENRMDDDASTGTYYFRTGSIFKKYCKEVMATPSMKVNGEYYMSLPFILMMRDNMGVLNVPIKKFICFGTPRDYEMYKFWSEFFLKYSLSQITFNNINIKSTNIYPLAGNEADFISLGIDKLNPLVPIMNKPLLNHAVNSLPKGVNNLFITLQELSSSLNLNVVPEHISKNSSFHYLSEKTQSNMETLRKVHSLVDPNSLICVSGTTYILDYDHQRLIQLLEKDDLDVILFVFSHHECVLRNPNGFHYASLENHFYVKNVIMKNSQTFKDPYKECALVGTAIYKNSSDFFESISSEIESNSDGYFLSGVNNLIKKGKKVAIFEVNKFIPIRSKNNYLEFKFWEDYFHNKVYHPYSKIIS